MKQGAEVQKRPPDVVILLDGSLSAWSLQAQERVPRTLARGVKLKVRLGSPQVRVRGSLWVSVLHVALTKVILAEEDLCWKYGLICKYGKLKKTNSYIIIKTTESNYIPKIIL